MIGIAAQNLDDGPAPPLAQPPHARAGEAGLTLIELLVVVFILSAIALSAASFVNDLDEQARFDDTRSRLAMIRTGVAGRPDRTVNGEPELAGFVADVGRLPANLDELLERPASIPVYAYDADRGLGGGWRGPYLGALPATGGVRAFPDGWGNPGGAPNHGWTFAPDLAAGTLVVKSLGSDGAAGGTGYAADYPDGAGGAALIVRHDHSVDLAALRVRVVFSNPADGGPALPAQDEVLRVRVHYPEDGSLVWPAAWPQDDAARDGAAYLSGDLTLVAGSVADGGSLALEFDHGAAAGVAKHVPIGARSLDLVRDASGARFGAGRPARLLLAPRVQLALPELAWPLE